VTETTMVRACEAADAQLHVLTVSGAAPPRHPARRAAGAPRRAGGRDPLALDNLDEAKRKATDAYTSLQRIRAEVLEVELVDCCPFDGLVEVHLREAGSGYMHEQWQCPLCGTEHEDSYHRSELD
jgi:hypothetical protein